MFGKNRRAKFAAFGALITLGFIVFQGVTDAHNPEVSASAVCIPVDTARITVNVHSWNTNLSDDHRTKDDVVVTIDEQTFHGAFNAANNFAFSFTLDVPADGSSYKVVASTTGPWGVNKDIEVPAQSRSAWVTVPEACPSEETTTTTTTTTLPATTSTSIPKTTVATTAPPASEVPVSVQGVVETAPTTIIGTAVEGVVLARTGTNAMPLVLGGLVLVLLGTAVELTARRRRNA